MERVVYTDIRRPDPESYAALRTYGVATIHEGMTESRLLTPGWGCVNVTGTVIGPVMTATNEYDDGMAVHRVVALAQEGDVIFIGHRRPYRGAVVGDLVALCAKMRGVAGIIVDGGIRDVAEIEEIGIPVWYRFIHPIRIGRDGLGAVNVPIMRSGAWINPGDIIAADKDGVLVIRPEEIAATIEGAAAREQREVATVERIRGGEATWDIFGLAEKAGRLGVREIPGPYPQD